MKTVILRDNGDGPELLIVDEHEQTTHKLDLGHVIKLTASGHEILMTYAIAGWKASR